MVRGSCVGDAELNRHPVEKEHLRPGGDHPGEVVTHMKDQLVASDSHLLGSKQWLFGAAIGIGADTFQQLSGPVGERPELDLHVARGAALGDVQNMSGEFRRHSQEASKSLSLSSAILKISASAASISCSRECFSRRSKPASIASFLFCRAQMTNAKPNRSRYSQLYRSNKAASSALSWCRPPLACSRVDAGVNVPARAALPARSG